MMKKKKKSILIEAENIVNIRDRLYGDPIKSWEEIAMITSILIKKELTALDCIMILKVMKMVRESYKHNVDNLIDEAGYLKIQEKLWK